MASEPIPEPLPHQEVKAEEAVSLPPERQLSPSSVVPMRTAGGTETPKTQLHAAAESVGVALGQAVNAVRDLSRRTGEVTEQGRRVAQDKVETVKDRVAQVSEEASRTTAETYEQAKTRVASAAKEAKQSAARHLEEARARAQHIANEFPLQVVAATAGAAFLAGVMLRIWRSNRDE